jgi:hypothetical protein
MALDTELALARVTEFLALLEPSNDIQDLLISTYCRNEGWRDRNRAQKPSGATRHLSSSCDV